MDDGYPESLLERIEISIAMQQRVLLAYTERRDQAIDRLPHGVAAAPQRSILSRRLPRQDDTAVSNTFQLEELALDILGGSLIANASMTSQRITSVSPRRCWSSSRWSQSVSG